MKAIALLLFALIAAATFYIFPWGMPPAANYFVQPPARELQADEIGQLKAVDRDYFVLANSGDDFVGWNTQRQSFWKYSIAFASYGMPSAMIIDPANSDKYRVIMDTMIWKMKSRKVWGDFTDRGFGSDPITTQNIMYKGHLNLMYGLYQLSTGDIRYAREYTWLTQQIADEMRLHHQGHYEGVTCEPNAWFVECNTIGMLSLHVYDKLYGTSYTDNEVQWSLDFIMNKMREPETGLFYSAYLPYHDTYRTQIRGYANAWILTFLHPFLPQEMEDLYPVFKKQLVANLGPYATVRYQIGERPDETAHLFGLWASKEFGDVELFGALRNTTDKFGRLGHDAETAGMAYGHEDNDMLNAGVVAAKMHLGWRAVLDHDWQHEALPYPIPDTDGMAWADLLPMKIFSVDSPNQSMPVDSIEKRPCPNCYWGDYQSVRMKKLGSISDDGVTHGEGH
jgi:hypothetical protein